MSLHNLYHATHALVSVLTVCTSIVLPFQRRISSLDLLSQTNRPLTRRVQLGWYQVSFLPYLWTSTRSADLVTISSTGQIPNIGPFQLIDKDTPQSAFTHQSLETGQSWELVFSDEFNNDGRTFFDGEQTNQSSCRNQLRRTR